ncbi:hypothetical protein, partial [Bradyrhizobium sp. th.b2]|uniref:hypothetical protein n=1 Tax=Bradyrhizobium sp. th-b2 TaxID=172088 RepID=UPI001AEBDFEA
RLVFVVIMPSVYQTERPFSNLTSGPKIGVHFSRSALANLSWLVIERIPPLRPQWRDTIRPSTAAFFHQVLDSFST